MKEEPQLMFGSVMHKRFLPKENVFSYRIYYMAAALSKLKAMPMRMNRPGIFSFYDKDHGARDGTPLEPWMRAILETSGLSEASGRIVLIALPRVLNYVFNPVSFWFCFDIDDGLRAVLCEVNNTFGESHNYLCAHEDHRVITSNDTLQGKKFFHVSPFLTVEGTYRFRFRVDGQIFAAWIDHYDDKENLTLATSLGGRFKPMTKANLRVAFWLYPLMTLRAVFLIHWQALKLFVKGVRYCPKPQQAPETLTQARNITKM